MSGSFAAEKVEPTGYGLPDQVAAIQKQVDTLGELVAETRAELREMALRRVAPEDRASVWERSLDRLSEGLSETRQRVAGLEGWKEAKSRTWWR